MAKRFKKLHFTLIEITVCFGILAIMLTILVRFLMISQGVWTESEKRAQAYADKDAFIRFLDSAVASAAGEIEVAYQGASTQKLYGKITINKCIKPGTAVFKDSLTVILEKDVNNDGVLSETEDNDDDCIGKVICDGQELISNVISLKFYNFYGVISVYIKMFGSEADFYAWKNLDNEDKKNEFFNQHGYTFTDMIIAQQDKIAE